MYQHRYTADTKSKLSCISGDTKTRLVCFSGDTTSCPMLINILIKHNRTTTDKEKNIYLVFVRLEGEQRHVFQKAEAGVVVVFPEVHTPVADWPEPPVDLVPVEPVMQTTRK